MVTIQQSGVGSLPQLALDALGESAVSKMAAVHMEERIVQYVLFASVLHDRLNTFSLFTHVCASVHLDVSHCSICSRGKYFRARCSQSGLSELGSKTFCFRGNRSKIGQKKKVTKVTHYVSIILNQRQKHHSL